MAHGGDEMGWSQIHPFVRREDIFSAAQQPGDWPRLPTLSEAMHQTNRLPIEVRKAFHREECVHSPLILQNLIMMLSTTTHHVSSS